MKWKALSLVAAVAGMVLPTVAQACPWALSSMFHQTGGRLSLGVNVAIAPFDGGSGLVPTVDLGIGLGDRFYLAPAVGICKESYDSGEDFSEMIYGAAAAVRLFSNDKVSVNAQTGISMVEYADFDEKYTMIPIVAAAQITASERASIFFGAGLEMTTAKFGSDSESDSDPMLFGGLNLMIKRLKLTGGIGAKIGDDDTDLSYNLGLRLPLGGS